MLRACSHVATAPISIRPLSRGCYSTLGRWRFLGLATFATLVWLYRCSRTVFGWHQCPWPVDRFARSVEAVTPLSVDGTSWVLLRLQPLFGFTVVVGMCVWLASVPIAVVYQAVFVAVPLILLLALSLATVPSWLCLS